MIKLFFSYSHKDENYRNELEKHLSLLKRNGTIDTWHDRRINAGADIDDEINKNLAEADIILLLISSDFLASDYCYDREMQEAMRKHNAHEAVVIPIILRPCHWHDAPFGKLLAAPTDGKPVTTYSNADQAFLEITQAIKTVATTLRAEPAPAPLQPSRQAINPLFASKNINVPRTFTDFEVDTFIDEAFAFMQQYFQSSLQAVEQQNPHVQTKYTPLDGQKFAAEAYVNGSIRARCMIFKGGLGGRSKAISYTYDTTGNTTSFNESLTTTQDGFGISFKPLGMTMMISSNDPLTKESAAEYYWSLFLKRLQQRY